MSNVDISDYEHIKASQHNLEAFTIIDNRDIFYCI